MRLLTRHQLSHKLLREKPWLRPGTGEFREHFVLRSIYVVGSDPSVLSNYCGMRREYVIAVCQKFRKDYFKNTRAFLNGETQPGLKIKDMVKGIGKAIGEKFTRRKLIKQRNSFMKKFGQGRRVAT